jgi:SOS-response transcriptional repressor LexA
MQLLPRNDAFAPIHIADGSELLVWGVVTGVIRQL